MSAPAPLMTVFGFLNRSHSFPAPLITLVTKEDAPDVHAIFPSGDVVRLMEKDEKTPATREKVMLRKTFVAAVHPVQSNDIHALTSYGIASDNIVVGPAAEILRRLDLAITCDQYTGDELERLTEAHQSWTDYVNKVKPAP